MAVRTLIEPGAVASRRMLIEPCARGRRHRRAQLAFAPGSTTATQEFVVALGNLFSVPMQSNAYQQVADLIFPPNSKLCAYTQAGGAMATLASASTTGAQVLTVDNMAGARRWRP